MNYAEAEEYINQIPRFSKVKSEENVDEILALFGHPEKKFAYIHVAGTNGKGSVCAYIQAILMQEGKRICLCIFGQYAPDGRKEDGALYVPASDHDNGTDED